MTALKDVQWLLVFVLSLSAAAQQPAMRDMPIGSMEELTTLFEQYHYTPRDWQAGIREVPRIYLDDIPSTWRREQAQQITVQQKKRVFFRLLAPIVLYVNEKIKEDRSQLQHLAARLALGKSLSAEDQQWLQQQAALYLKNVDREASNQTLVDALMPRIDIVPASLALAQGAIESGWGTSRFADEGNSLFGQWSWSGGIKPAEQRSAEHGDHRIAAFESTGMSVWSYMLNLNTHAAYRELRQRRAELRKQGKPVRGRDLVGAMTAYSERGDDYVKDLKAVMRQNQLDAADDAYLKPMTIIRIVPDVE